MCMLEDKIIGEAFRNGREVKIDLEFQGVHDCTFEDRTHFIVDSKHYMTLPRFMSDIGRFRDMMLECEHFKAINLVTD